MEWQLDYEANDTFAQVHMDQNKYMFIRGSVGSGKSSGCIMHCWLNALDQAPDANLVRRSRYGILRATYPNLKSTTVESWKEWFGPLIKIVYDVPIRGTLKMDHPDGKTKVEMELVFLALDREEDIIKLQSLQLVGAHLNETAEIPRGVFQMLKSRIDRYPKKFFCHKDYEQEYSGYKNKLGKIGAVDPFIISDYNSVPTEHWLYTIAEEEKPCKGSQHIADDVRLPRPRDRAYSGKPGCAGVVSGCVDLPPERCPVHYEHRDGCEDDPDDTCERDDAKEQLLADHLKRF